MPCVCVDDPPAGEQLASDGGVHVAAMSFGRSDQVIGGGCEGKGPGDLFPTSVLHSSDSADRLHPAKALLDALADALADLIARVTRCAAIDGGAAGRVLGDVRRHVDLTQFPDEVRRIEALVATERDRVRSVGIWLDHIERGQPFGMPETLVERASTKRRV